MRNCSSLPLAGLATIFLPGLASAQSASPQTAKSPWSLHDALQLPSDLKLSASLRGRYESVDGQPRPGFNDHDVIINLRTTVFAEYDTGPIRLGAEIYDSRVYAADARTPLTTGEVNAAELIQAYAALDLKTPFGAGSTATVQIGRFDLNLGSRRLVSSDDYRNTTNGYTGLRFDANLAAGMKATGIYVLPQTRRPEALRDLLRSRVAFDHEGLDAVLWGGLASKKDALGAASLELSFFHFGEHDRRDGPTRNRSLNTSGARVFRAPDAGSFDFEIEGLYQWGTIRGSSAVSAPLLDVSASFLHGDVGYTLASSWKPRVSLRIDRASGDRRGGTFSRFDTLFGGRASEFGPTGLYNAVGRANLLSPAIRIEAAPGEVDDIFVHYSPLWLASRTDSFSTSAVIDATGRSGRFAGHQVEARWRHWLVLDALRFEAEGVYLAKGAFLRRAPNAPRNGDTRYLSLNLTAFF